MRVQLIAELDVIEINRAVCNQYNQLHSCPDIGKVQSALGAAFFPGSYPFAYGGIARVAGALCFFITKAHAFVDGNKRTAGIAADVFLKLNGYKLIYPLDSDKDINAFSEIIEKCAASLVSKDEIIEWFDTHKASI